MMVWTDDPVVKRLAGRLESGHSANLLLPLADRLEELGEPAGIYRYLRDVHAWGYHPKRVSVLGRSYWPADALYVPAKVFRVMEDRRVALKWESPRLYYSSRCTLYREMAKSWLPGGTMLNVLYRDYPRLSRVAGERVWVTPADDNPSQYWAYSAGKSVINVHRDDFKFDWEA